MLTIQQLIDSPEYKSWITGDVSLIHNLYHDSIEPYGSYIVIHGNMGKWNITRFFQGGGKIQVSQDHTNISTDTVFQMLLSEYSRGLA